jgi:multimeric flavodoxin WrbA
MKILVINGSPKGSRSITLQYCRILEYTYNEHDFVVKNVASEIRRLENDENYWNELMDMVKSSDLILWSFGLWVLAVSAQLMRFFELIKEKNAGSYFVNKYCGIISTSIHYFDHTAQTFVKDTSEDLGMIVADQISFHMKDLADDERAKMLLIFGKNVIKAVENKTLMPKYKRNESPSFIYEPGTVSSKIDSNGKSVLLLTDGSNGNCEAMIKRFQDCFQNKITIVNLNDINIKGACTGCMRCGYDYKCVYHDGFEEFYNTTVRAADIIVHCGDIKGRYLSSLWKTFFDRAFFWNHTPSLQGKQFLYLLSGSIRDNHNLVQILEAHASARQHANHAGIICDEIGSSAELDVMILDAAKRVLHYAEASYVRPEDFLGAGGWKIFRDEIYAGIRMVWQADHRYFKRNGYYDFPNKKWIGRSVISLMMWLTRIPGFRRKFYGKLNEMPSRRMGRIAERYKVKKNENNHNIQHADINILPACR